MSALERRLEGRLVGLDVARCLALVGMIGTHVLDSHTPSGGLAPWQAVAGGRAAALFAVLAGVSLALMTRRGASPATYAALALRALMIALLGLVLGALDTDIAVILTYYGVLFLLGLPFVRLGARWLLVLGGLWVVVGPVVSQLVRPHLPERGVASPYPEQLAEPGRLLAELCFTGYYPVVPWLAYLLVGMGLGRLALRCRATAAGVALAGLGTAVVSMAVSRGLTALPGVRDRLAADLPIPDGVDPLEVVAGGMFGQTPVDGGWEWLLVVAPHSTTPFDLAHTIGTSLLVIGACLLVESLVPAAGRVFLAVALGAGAMTLTLYSLHVAMSTPEVWPSEVPGSLRWHLLVVLAIGAAYAAAGQRGPLETVVGLPTRALRRERADPV